ncbi:MAG: NAD(+) synthase [Desulfovibrionaceae bacterium]|nr:NAD(+) synthase [Desulfovibrionaceae bacterium]
MSLHPTFEICQIKQHGFDLEANAREILAAANASTANYCLFSAEAFCPQNLTLVPFKQALSQAVLENLTKIAAGLKDSVQLILLAPIFNDGCLEQAVFVLGRKDYQSFSLRSLFPWPFFLAQVPILSPSLDGKNEFFKLSVLVPKQALPKEAVFDLNNLDDLALELSSNFDSESVDELQTNAAGEDPAPKNNSVIAILAAIPFTFGVTNHLGLAVKTLAQKTAQTIYFVNALGSFEQLIYFGGSFSVQPDGKFLALKPLFREDGEICTRHDPVDWEGELWEALVLGTKDYLEKVGNPRVFLGLSGGIDSALVLAIVAEACPRDLITPVLMPSPFNPKSSEDDALQLCANLELSPFIVPISELFAQFKVQLATHLNKFPENPLTFENLQARIRAVILMALANQASGLILNTSNKSEVAMGYSTLYGDTVGALAVIGDIFKTQVYALAKWYNAQRWNKGIPENILTKAPSAELRLNQKDSDSLPDYEALDPILARFLAGHSPHTALEKDIYKRVIAAEFKRCQEPHPLIVSETPFSNFHLPVVAQFLP